MKEKIMKGRKEIGEQLEKRWRKQKEMNQMEENEREKMEKLEENDKRWEMMRVWAAQRTPSQRHETCPPVIVSIVGHRLHLRVLRYEVHVAWRVRRERIEKEKERAREKEKS